MSAALVCIDKRRHMEATGVIMADFLEIINLQTMTGRLYIEGEIVEEYKIEQCDKCSQLRKLDSFGYQKGYGNEKIIWFCGDCR